jgi:hypothetical protein
MSKKPVPIKKNLREGSVRSSSKLNEPLTVRELFEDEFKNLQARVEVKSQTETERRFFMRKDNLTYGIAWALIAMFIFANGITAGALFVAWGIDDAAKSIGAEYLKYRLWDTRVLLALIAATTAQLGIIAVIISKWLYK